MLLALMVLHTLVVVLLPLAVAGLTPPPLFLISRPSPYNPSPHHLLLLPPIRFPSDVPSRSWPIFRILQVPVPFLSTFLSILFYRHTPSSPLACFAIVSRLSPASQTGPSDPPVASPPLGPLCKHQVNPTTPSLIIILPFLGITRCPNPTSHSANGFPRKVFLAPFPHNSWWVFHPPNRNLSYLYSMPSS